MGKKKRVLLGIAALLVAIIAAACLWYARPMTIEEMFPALDLENCTRAYVVSTYDGTGRDEGTLVTPDNLTPLLELFQGRKFRRSPFFWLPKGIRAHELQEGDFSWYIDFAYQDAPMTDFSTATGYLLHFDNFYGELEMRVGEATWPVRTADQEQWLADVQAYILEAEAEIESN